MITMREEEYIPSKAVEYLRDRHGIIITVVGLRQRRRRGTAKTSKVYARTSLWKQSELDAIALNVSPKTKRVVGHDQQENS